MGDVNIRENVRSVLQELPEGVELVLAAKGRKPEEVIEAVEAGGTIVGENYVQQAEEAFSALGNRVRWHFIGHLQRNKVKRAVEIFDVIETVDSFTLAEEIDRRSRAIDKVTEVLIEVNSAREPQKFGVFPEEVGELVEEIAPLTNIRVMGLMTMGPFSGDPEEARPYFKETRKVFEGLKAAEINDVKMKYLSMGMTNSYRVAIEEGANIVRIGTKIFGERG